MKNDFHVMGPGPSSRYLDRIARYSREAKPANSCPEVEFRPSGTPELDWVIGHTGLPVGRTIELFGAESTGKTTLALRALVAQQNLERRSAYFETERKFDPRYAEYLGLDLSKVKVFFPTSIEDCLYNVIDEVARHRPPLVVIDSLGG